MPEIGKRLEQFAQDQTGWSRAKVRLFIYSAQALFNFMLAGLSVEMFGGGANPLTWPEFVLRWTMFTIGATNSVFNVWRAFIDDTAGKTNMGTGDGGSEPQQM